MKCCTMLVYRNQPFCICRVRTGLYSLRMALAGGQLSSPPVRAGASDVGQKQPLAWCQVDLDVCNIIMQSDRRVHACTSRASITIKLCGPASQLKHLAQKKIEELNHARERRMFYLQPWKVITFFDVQCFRWLYSDWSSTLRIFARIHRSVGHST